MVATMNGFDSTLLICSSTNNRHVKRFNAKQKQRQVEEKHKCDYTHESEPPKFRDNHQSWYMGWRRGLNQQREVAFKSAPFLAEISIAISGYFHDMLSVVCDASGLWQNE